MPVTHGRRDKFELCVNYNIRKFLAVSMHPHFLPSIQRRGKFSELEMGTDDDHAIKREERFSLVQCIVFIDCTDALLAHR